MNSDDELDIDEVLRAARASNVDPIWIRRVEALVREVRRLESKVDELTNEVPTEPQLRDTDVFKLP